MMSFPPGADLDPPGGETTLVAVTPATQTLPATVRSPAKPVELVQLQFAFVVVIVHVIGFIVLSFQIIVDEAELGNNAISTSSCFTSSGHTLAEPDQRKYHQQSWRWYYYSRIEGFA